MKSIDESSSRKISWLMFVLSFLIVLRHSSGYDNYDMPSTLTLTKVVIDTIRFDGIFNLVLPTFFVVSGFLFYKNCDEKNITEKLKRRVHSLLIPYLIFNTFWMLVMAVVELFPSIAGSISSTTRFTFSVVNVLEGIFYYKYNPVFWFVFQLILYCCISPLLLRILKRKPLGIALIAVSFILYALGVDCGILVVKGLFYYSLGGFLAIHCFDVVNKRFKPSEVVVAVIALCVTVIVYPVLPYYSIPTALITVLQVVAVWVIADLLKNCKVFWWTKIHFFIYGMHQIPQLCINKVIVALTKDWHFALVNFVGGGILTLVLLIFLAYILKSAVKPVWGVLNGGRDS